MIWGKQDPHVPTAGRQKIYQQLIDKNLDFEWHEVNGQHAFMRDEGERYDPELALRCYRLSIDHFRAKL
jgi:carboxymethylenebutenolidase